MSAVSYGDLSVWGSHQFHRPLVLRQNKKSSTEGRPREGKFVAAHLEFSFRLQSSSQVGHAFSFSFITDASASSSTGSSVNCSVEVPLSKSPVCRSPAPAPTEGRGDAGVVGFLAVWTSAFNMLQFDDHRHQGQEQVIGQPTQAIGAIHLPYQHRRCRPHTFAPAVHAKPIFAFVVPKNVRNFHTYYA